MLCHLEWITQGWSIYCGNLGWKLETSCNTHKQKIQNFHVPDTLETGPIQLGLCGTTTKSRKRKYQEMNQMPPRRAAGLLIMGKLSVQFCQWTIVFWECSIWDSCCGPFACSSVWEKSPFTFLNCKWVTFSWSTGKLVGSTCGQLWKYNKVNTKSKI